MGGVSGLIERTPTLEELELEIGRGLDGGGRLVLVEGAAGIGKTRVLDAVAAAPREARVLHATAGQYERDLAFGVARRLLGPEAFAASGPVPVDVDVGAVLEALHLRVLEMAEARPLLIVVDDLHWADAPSVRLLAYLARRLEGAPLALLAGVRTGAGDLAALREPALGAHSVVLGPLSADGSARLLAGLLGRSRADGLSDSCHQATGGNPFLLQTMARSLAAREAGAPQEPDALALGAAADVDAWVRAQLDALGDDAGAVLEAIAVLGDDAPLATVAAVAERAEGATAAAIDSLVAARLLAADGRGFAHPLVHAAVREAMPAGRRSLVTGRAARLLALDQGDVARAAALLRGRPRVGEAWAGELLREAGELAMREGAPAEAAELWRACLEEPLGAEARFETTLALGELECAQAEAAGMRHLERAADLAADSPASARAALARGRVLQLQGQVDAKIALLEAELERLGDADPDLGEEIEGELALLAITATSVRRRTLPRLRLLLDRVEAGEGPDNALALSAVAGELALAGRCEEALGCARAARDHLGRDARGGATGPIISSVLYVSEAWAEVDVHYESVLADPRRSIFLAADAMTGRALIRLHRGDVLGAEEAARMALELRDDHIVQPLKRAVLADSLVEQERVEEALAETAGAAEAGEMDEGTLGQMLLGARARVLHAAGRHPEVLACGERARAFEREWGTGNPNVVRWREPVALSLAACGDPEAARALAAESLEVAAATGMPIATATARRTVALLAPEGPDTAELRAVAAALGSEYARLERARTLVELGAALREAGEVEAARAELGAGRELAHACGSERLERRAREELLASGARPRRIALSGRASLTPAEDRVAELAAAGLANPAIAAQLVISRRTVEMHLSNAYRKLGITSRQSLAAALAA
jgi:DNA-binding CsgD family transcriptional regulator